MMNSFYNGISGVKTNSFGIDIYANNIANVNTTGFKYSDAQFKDIFYSTITTQSTNPAQGGYGSGSASSNVVFEQGSLVASDSEFDVALQGKGFLGFWERMVMLTILEMDRLKEMQMDIW